MPQTWDEFSREMFGDPYLVWHDGADFGSLFRRWQDQPQLVATMLQLGVSSADPVAAEAITYLHHRGADLTEIGSALRAALPDASATFRVRVAEALFTLTRDQRSAAPICDVLTGQSFWGDKIDAAVALSAFAPTAQVIQALGQGVQDLEYLVRRHSAQTLLTLAGKHTRIEKDPDLWADIKDSSPRAWRKAAAELARPWPD